MKNVNLKKSILDSNMTVNNLYNLYDNDGNFIIDLILESMYLQLKNFQDLRINKTNDSIIMINKGLNLITDISYNDKNIDQKKVEEKLEKFSIKIENILSNSKLTVNDKKNLKRIIHNTDELVDIINNFKDDNISNYKFINHIAFNVKNIYFLKNIFYHFPEAVNLVNLKNHTLMYSTVMKYLNACSDSKEFDEDLIDYYTKVISVIIKNKSFRFREDEKSECVYKLLDTVNKLDPNNPNFTLKKKVLEFLETSLCFDDQKDIVLDKTDYEEEFDQKIFNVMHNDLIFSQSNINCLRDDYVISIDSVNTERVDDALSVKKLDNGGYEVGIHIAAVTSYFDFYSEIVQNALYGGENIYDYDVNNLKMFPYEFSSKIASLCEQVPRFAQSLYLNIAPDGEILNKRFLKTIINNRRKLSYNEVDLYLKYGCNDKKLLETINNLRDVFKIIRKRYNFSKNVNAESIVMSCMLLNNEEIAKFFHENNYETVYRVRQKIKEEDQKIIKMTKDFVDSYKNGNDPKRQRIINRMLNYEEGASYALEGTYLLHNKKIYYTHASSPLRRRADIVVQRGIDLYCHHLGTDKDVYRYEEELPHLVEVLNKKEDKDKQFVKEINMRYRF